MADLKKLDEIVEQLGTQSEKLMSFSEIYAEIDKIKADLESNINSFGTSSEKLDKASDSLQDKTKKLTDKLTEIQGAIMQRVDSIETSNKKNHTELQNKVKEHTAKLTEIQGSLMQRVDLIEESNKKFQRDFDSEITSKLTKHKSDIEVTIRDGGAQTAKAIESTLNTTFLKELNDLNSKANKLTDKANDLNKKALILIVFGIAIFGLNVFLIQSLIN